MAPVIPCSVTNVSLIPGTSFTLRRSNYLTRCNFLRKFSKHTLSSQKFSLPLSTSVRLFQPYTSGCVLHRKSRIYILSATGTDVAVEEPDSPIADNDSDRISEIPSTAVKASEDSSIKLDASAVQPKRSKPSRKSEMPPVKNEELVPGATFTGKVRSIQPFGAFVDFGAFTDGLVHVSRLSDSFVKDVGSVVSVGQQVTVRLVEANTETGRISLSMRENDDISKIQQPKDAPASSDNTRPTRKSTSMKKSSKFVKGQDLEGIVKNLIRSGAFISLPEGEEGFLPLSEESDEGFVNIMGGSSLQVGQKVSVQVLRITRGQVTLTMKRKDTEGLDSQIVQGVVHVATNPFMLAFRKNKDIAAFLEEREKVMDSTEIKESPKNSEERDETVNQKTTGSAILKVQEQPAGINEELVNVPSAVDELVEEEDSLQEVDGGTNTVDGASTVSVKNDEKSGSMVSSSSQNSDCIVQTTDEMENNYENLDSDNAKKIITEDSITDEVENIEDSRLEGEITDNILSSESMVSKVIGSQADDTIAKDEVQIQTASAKNQIVAAADVDDQKVAPIIEEHRSISSSNGQIDVSMNEGQLEYDGKVDPSGEVADDQRGLLEHQVGKETVENQADDSMAKDEVQIQKPVADIDIPSATPVEDEKAGPEPEKNYSHSKSNGQTGFFSPKENMTRATISPALVKHLREETGAGMMDCKKALSETGGDIVKAQEFLRKKGLASADKKAGRATAEGRIGSYIHDCRIGVLIEVNCETDFVSRGDIFKELVDDLAMQVAACPLVQYLATEDVPEELVNKEKEIEMQKEDLLSKPEQIRLKIVEGRIRKGLEELALLEQPYIKNDKVVVKDWVKKMIATIGENIKVKRFVRYNLGEGLEKKSQDFAAEVAAQTAGKPVPQLVKEQAGAAEAKEAVQKPPMVTITAAMVKQLREETGAGMMDCKRALSETGGDVEKAQVYLRKKGLSTADKKSSRLAAEGRVGSYVHDSRIGVLIEVNCETDFVGRSENFKEFVADLAMQVVACPQVQFVSVEEIPESIFVKEKELEMQREDLLSKPENIRERIVEGRVSKRLGEFALLEQPFIKNDSILVKDLLNQTVAALGENIKVRRFARFTLGESTTH
ncbi:polyprotein of EF-Ts, chloroplastic [Malania oleifera]|uniref:polyprotein of EF-Ts, chloroplastic n=1 Tax=Malania oleifera TaxID=397392 RepID=UPI0025ADF9FA|nr:polyprotein of EF-Ts, chloroplastic [Malania oleifera]XP_057973472.1 polyprotein of EF-Ts, chloroplastic [Malania oleifera]XP_057973473.1 polyprotein of EF-Ts, chloroplastic [Malania oleifera]XP_057973474.1 polyprotein of EF-Ts, chloroplastic [Malania oleifera]XP_057973475.1 polyprotein of EF-Ts, chloroplastic [Malania oleifera]